jgi:CheY-like chemotaxis protein
MPDRLTVEMTTCPPHAAELPLSGVTVLVVDDSRLACDGLRLMCRRLGARLRRAESLQTAEVHLRVYRPDVVIVDLGLPDGRGEALIRRLAQEKLRPVVLGLSGDGNGRWTSMAAGADGYLDKPLESLAQFQMTLLDLLPLRAGSAVALPDLALPPDPLALRDDLAYAAALLERAPDASTRHYLAGFLSGVARQSRDRALAEAALRAPSKGLHDALQARLALPDQAFAHLGLPLGG